MKLFCFTHAGGTASFFDQIKSEVAPDISLIALEYAGHGTRHKESFYENFSELTADMVTLLMDNLVNGEPYALFGYSMGTIVAVDVLRNIVSSGVLHYPEHLFLAAYPPYTNMELKNFDGECKNELVKRRTINFGAVSESLAHNRVFWRVYLPVYRADYSLIGKFRFEEFNLKTNIPLTVFYSETDTPFLRMRQWSSYFNGSCDFLEYTGNHFFINDNYEEISSEIKRRLVG